MSTSEHEMRDVQTVDEAIVVVDLVDSTKTITRHGWRTVGQGVIRNLRACIKEVGLRYGLHCRKYTGDGYMLTFYNRHDTAQAAVQALHAVAAIAQTIEDLNASASQERRIRLRFALHYGEVDVIEEEKMKDREGPEVSYTFRLEGVSANSLEQAYDPMPTEKFPPHDYVILSQKVIEILNERRFVFPWKPEPIGVLPLKGFDGYHRLYLLRNLSALRF